MIQNVTNSPLETIWEMSSLEFWKKKNNKKIKISENVTYHIFPKYSDILTFLIYFSKNT